MLQYDWKAIVENEEKMMLQPLFILPTFEITVDTIQVEANLTINTGINLTSYIKDVFNVDLQIERNQ